MIHSRWIWLLIELFSFGPCKIGQKWGLCQVSHIYPVNSMTVWDLIHLKGSLLLKLVQIADNLPWTQGENQERNIYSFGHYPGKLSFERLGYRMKRSLSLWIYLKLSPNVVWDTFGKRIWGNFPGEVALTNEVVQSVCNGGRGLRTITPRLHRN